MCNNDGDIIKNTQVVQRPTKLYFGSPVIGRLYKLLRKVECLYNFHGFKDYSIDLGVTKQVLTPLFCWYLLLCGCCSNK